MLRRWSDPRRKRINSGSISLKNKGMSEAAAITVKKKIGLLIAAFSIALVVGLCGLLFGGLEIHSFEDVMFVLAFGFAMFPGYLWLWPMLRLLPESAGALMFPAIVGWFVYAALGRAIVKAERPSDCRRESTISWRQVRRSRRGRKTRACTPF